MNPTACGSLRRADGVGFGGDAIRLGLVVSAGVEVSIGWATVEELSLGLLDLRTQDSIDLKKLLKVTTYPNKSVAYLLVPFTRAVAADVAL